MRNTDPLNIESVLIDIPMFPVIPNEYKKLFVDVMPESVATNDIGTHASMSLLYP